MSERIPQTPANDNEHVVIIAMMESMWAENVKNLEKIATDDSIPNTEKINKRRQILQQSHDALKGAYSYASTQKVGSPEKLKNLLKLCEDELKTLTV
jgi:hypothetical protein